MLVMISRSVRESLPIETVKEDALPIPRPVNGLLESIRDDGLMYPIVVRKNQAGVYAVHDGHRRLKACKMLGFTHIDAEVFIGDGVITVI